MRFWYSKIRVLIFNSIFTSLTTFPRIVILNSDSKMQKFSCIQRFANRLTKRLITYLNIYLWVQNEVNNTGNLMITCERSNLAWSYMWQYMQSINQSSAVHLFIGTRRPIRHVTRGLASKIASIELISTHSSAVTITLESITPEIFLSIIQSLIWKDSDFRNDFFGTNSQLFFEFGSDWMTEYWEPVRDVFLSFAANSMSDINREYSATNSDYSFTTHRSKGFCDL